MKRIIPSIVVSLLTAMVLASCTANISGDARFKNLIGHSLKTKVPLKLYQLDYQLNAYRDRYQLGGNIGGQLLVGIIPAGHSVLFERAICKVDPSASTEYLEGVIEFRGRTYPIAYFLGLGGQEISDFWKGLNYDFAIPVSK